MVWRTSAPGAAAPAASHADRRALPPWNWSSVGTARTPSAGEQPEDRLHANGHFGGNEAPL